MSDFPHNVVPEIARQFIQQASPYDGGGLCLLKYGPQVVHVDCTTDKHMLNGYIALLIWFIFLSFLYRQIVGCCNYLGHK